MHVYKSVTFFSEATIQYIYANELLHIHNVVKCSSYTGSAESSFVEIQSKSQS